MKKTTKRKIAKKAPVKRTRKIKDVPPEKCFWVNNGPVVKNLKELADALKTMNDEQFDYHTKRSGNDFASWIKEVLGKKECSNKVSRAKTRAGVLKVLKACI